MNVVRLYSVNRWRFLVLVPMLMKRKRPVRTCSMRVLTLTLSLAAASFGVKSGSEGKGRSLTGRFLDLLGSRNEIFGSVVKLNLAQVEPVFCDLG
jgi:hypothetical protein